MLTNGDDISLLSGNNLKPTLTGDRLNVLNVINMLDDDAAPPADVIDLAVTSAGLLSVSVSWTAVGNDGSNGQAGSYDLRYSTSPIDEGNWASATQAVGEPAPQTSGTVENFEITNLDHSTTYHIGLKVLDQSFNESGLSNVVPGITDSATTVFQDDMESGINGWIAVGNPGLWHQSQRRSTSTDTAWYYGMEFFGNYDTGLANDGTLTSPAINLTDFEVASLIFKEWSEVEASVGWDRTRVQVSTDATNWTLVYESHGTSGVWADRSVDLTPYVGGFIYLRFFFETRDAIYNNFEGWYVDDVLVLATGGNSPPVADPGAAYAGVEDLPVAFDGSGSWDPESDPLTYDWDFGDGSPHGTGMSPSHSYTAGGNYTVTLVVNDGMYDSPPVSATATITEVNDPPVANDDIALVTEGGSVDIDVRSNDTDMEDTTPSGVVTITIAPSNGTATLNADGTVKYTHNGIGTTSDSFKYTVEDSGGVASGEAVVSITIAPVNDPPVANDDTGSVAEGGSVDVDVRSNDTDMEDTTPSRAIASHRDNTLRR